MHKPESVLERIGAFGMIPKGLERVGLEELEIGQIETMQTC